MQRYQVWIAGVVASLFFASGALAAPFIKYEGVEGESKASQARPNDVVGDNDNMISYSEINATAGEPLTVVDQRGRASVLQKDGVYRTSDGGQIWVRNGRVFRTRGHEVSHHLGVSPTGESGHSLHSGEAGEQAPLLPPAVQKIRPSMKSDSGSPAVTNPSTGSATKGPKRKGNIDYEWKVEKGE